MASRDGSNFEAGAAAIRPFGGDHHHVQNGLEVRRVEPEHVEDPPLAQVEQAGDPRLLIQRQQEQYGLRRSQRLLQQPRESQRMSGKGDGQASKEVEPGLRQRQEAARCAVAGVFDE
jgi:uncharacterized protein involved in copper resistance